MAGERGDAAAGMLEGHWGEGDQRELCWEQTPADTLGAFTGQKPNTSGGLGLPSGE